jgi:hypothetical protein
VNVQEQLQRKGANIPRIAEQIIKEPECIDQIVEGLKAPRGTARYVCDKVLRLVSEQKPELIYPHFDVFVEMLDHDNSFLKWGAILTLANLAAVDAEGRFEKIFAEYYAPITGSAMVTAANIIGGSARIAKAKPKLTGKITREILKVEKAAYERHSLPSPECRNIAIGQAIDSFDQFFDQIDDKDAVVKFVKRQLKNTRKPVVKKAEKFLSKHEL